jgi:Zn-dependent protease
VGFGFGWAKPVPVNPLRYKNMKRDEIIVSLAGVTANFLLMIFTAIVMKILVVAGLMNLDFNAFSHPAGLQDYLQNLLLRFFFLNGILFVFNLIPVPPLDGSHVLIWLFARDPMMTEAKLSRFGFLFIFILLFTRILNYIVDFALSGMLLFLRIFF